MKKNRQPFFSNKTCDICKKKASMFRVTKNKKFMLCDSKNCDFVSRIRAGLVVKLNIEK